MTKKDENPSNDMPLEEIGDALRQQRDKRQLALQDCAEQLKIRHRYLDSLEQGNPDDLPGDIFYINFVKSYANMLGLAGEDFASKARKALHAQGRLRELESVMQHRSTKKEKKEAQAPSEDASNLTLKLATNLATSLGEGEASRVSSLSASPGSAPSDFTSSSFALPSLPSEGRFPLSPITNPDTERQLLRETLLSPLVLVGGLIGVVLLYLGAVIVTDLLGKGGEIVTTDTAVSLEADDEQVEEETLVEVVEDARAPRIYGALGAARIEVWAKEACRIAVFATDISLGKREQAELLFAETLLEGDRYRVPAELGIILKGGNLSCLTFVVRGAVVDPFRIPSPSGFMSLEPSHLRTRTAIREGGVLARERLPVVLEIELLRQQRAERALELEGGNP